MEPWDIAQSAYSSVRGKSEAIRARLSVGMLAVVAIVMVAFTVRYYGVWWGFPDLLYGDEHDVAGQALKMILSFDLSPDRFFKTATYSYMLIPVYIPLAVSLFLGFVFGFYDTPAFIELWRYYYAARTVSALFGTATVLLVYLVGKRMFNRKVGLIAALFFCFDLLHVETSHYAKAYTPSAFFAVMSFLFAIRVYQEGRWRDYILAGLFAGLATTIQYNAIFIFFPLILAHILHELNGGVPFGRIIISQRLYLGLICVGLGFVLGNPFVISDSAQFIWAMQEQFQKVFQVVQADALGNEVSRGGLGFMPHRLGKYTGIITGSMGLLGFGLAIVGCVHSLVKRDPVSFLALFFVLPTFLLVSQYWLASAPYVLPLMPFLYLWAARLLVDSVDTVAARCKLVAGGYVNVILLVGVAGVALWSPAHAVVRLDSKFAAKDTRTLAKEWMTANLLPGAVKIAREENVLPIPGYQSREYWTLDMHDFDFYLRRGYTHLAMDSWHPPRDDGFMTAMAERTTQLAEITDKSTGGLGPTIRVYRIQPAPTQMAPSQEIKAEFDGKLRLLGYEIDKASVRPGDLFNVALYWECLVPTQKDYEFVLTVEKDGQAIIRHRRRLLHGFLPTSEWQTGQVVIDDNDYLVPQREWYTMTDADQQKYFCPELERGFRLGLGPLGRLTLRKEVQPPDGEIIRLTLERKVKGGKAVEEPDPVVTLYSKKGADAGSYGMWLEVSGNDGESLNVTGRFSSSLYLGAVQVASVK